MQIPVFIERVAQNGFRARSGEPLAVSVEAPTRAEALAKLESELAARLTGESQLVAVELPAIKNPWLAIAGSIAADDPLIDEWKQSMAGISSSRKRSRLSMTRHRDTDILTLLRQGHPVVVQRVTACARTSWRSVSSASKNNSPVGVCANPTSKNLPMSPGPTTN